MGWVDARDYEDASSDPLAGAAPGILAHMNANHVDSKILLGRLHAGIGATEATVTWVDRLGFTLRLETNEGMKGVRINFLREVATPMETRTCLSRWFAKPDNNRNLVRQIAVASIGDPAHASTHS